MATRKKKNVVELSRSHFEPYEPAKDEEYMSKGQLEHFKQILLNWRQELMEEVDRTVHHMKDESINLVLSRSTADLVGRGSCRCSWC